MEINYEKTTYFKFTFEFKFDKEILEFCRKIRNDFGSREMTYTSGRWRFNNPAIMFVIKEKYPTVIIDPRIMVEIEKEEKRIAEEVQIEKRAMEIKNATESNLVIKGIKGEMRPYQKLGVEFFLNNKGRGMLADGMGAGKTIQSLAYLVKAEHKRTLVISPASVKFSWKNEVKRWTNLKSFVIDSQTIFSEISHEVNVIIINYDILGKFKNELLKAKFDCMVADEATYVKSPTATRSKIVKMLAKNIPSVIFLTGTPLLSRPVELYNMLTMIDPYTWNDYYSFCGRYCEGHMGYFGYEAKGATNLEELQGKISKYFLRRTKDQILKELPPKNFIEYPVELDKETKVLYYKAANNLIEYLKQNKGKTDKQAEKTMRAEKLVKINLLREINTMGKLTAAKELIDSIIESGEKVLVFSSFNAPLLELQEEYLDSCLIIGSTPVEERETVVKRFQTNPDCKIFFGGYKSAGIGITLTAASNVILLDMPWTNADKNQTIDRAHRIGSTAESLNIYEFYTEKTIDEFMKKLLNRKQKIFDQVIDGKSPNMERDTVEEVIRMIEEQNNL